MSPQTIKSKGKVFRDPVHRLIRIEPEDQFALDLINTSEFQRLRRVRQLGVSSLTYHGAEHSRFVHSIGVFNFAQRIIGALHRRYGTKSTVSQHLDEHSRPLKAAALLHDIGHGPFSHMIERASQSTFDHEKMTARIIRDESSAVHKALKHHMIDPGIVADIISKVFPHRLVVDIVSSQLDADRMDYLLRDSLMTGVEYGVYDAEWLLNAMCVARDPGASHDDLSTGAWRLCLDRDRGLFAAEQLILARHHMMLQVYMHRVTRGYEVLLLNLFQHAAALAKEGQLPSGTPQVVQSYFKMGINMPLQDWMMFDETAMVSAMQGWARAESNELDWFRRSSEAFLERQRLYQAVQIGKLGVTQSMELQSGLSEAGLKRNRDWGLDDGKHLPYKGVYYGAAEGGGEEEQSTLSILLSDGELSSRGEAVENNSQVLKALDNQREFITRLYIDRDRIADAAPILKKLKLIPSEAS